MDSFLKDALSAIILASWVFPVLYLALYLVAGKLLALLRHVRGDRGPRPPARTRRVPAAKSVRPDVQLPATPLVPAARHNPVRTVGVAATRLARPRVASRWKSSQRLNVGVGTC